MEPNAYLIADILPKYEIHLLGGGSGVGKTRFLFQLFISEWQEGRPVLGHKSYPVPYVYISMDRSRPSVGRTLATLGLEKVITRVVTREDLESPITAASMLKQANAKYPDAEVFFIEGFQTLVGDAGNNYTTVATFLSRITRYCNDNKITIVGVCHSPKLLIDESFKNTREMVLGSVAWGSYSDTNIVMSKDEKTGIITISVQPRNAGSENHSFTFNKSGKLIPLVQSTQAQRSDLRIYIESLGSGELISRKQVLDRAKEYGISRATAERVVDECFEDGMLEQFSWGNYVRTNRAVAPFEITIH